MTCNREQVGGDHYVSDYQLWDYIVEHNICYLAGCAAKYIYRYKTKHSDNGKSDLLKALHYVRKLQECLVVNRTPCIKNNGSPKKYLDYHLSDFAYFSYINSLDKFQNEVCRVLFSSLDENSLKYAEYCILFMLEMRGTKNVHSTKKTEIY